MAEDQPRSQPARVFPILGVLVGLYFFCPYVYCTPWLLIYGRHWKPSGAVMACFTPVVYLSSHVPAYGRFLNEEESLLGLY